MTILETDTDENTERATTSTAVRVGYLGTCPGPTYSLTRSAFIGDSFNYTDSHTPLTIAYSHSFLQSQGSALHYDPNNDIFGPNTNGASPAGGASFVAFVGGTDPLLQQTPTLSCSIASDGTGSFTCLWDNNDKGSIAQWWLCRESVVVVRPGVGKETVADLCDEAVWPISLVWQKLG